MIKFWMVEWAISSGLEEVMSSLSPACSWEMGMVTGVQTGLLDHEDEQRTC